MGGIASLISCGGALLRPGVKSVRPRVLDFRIDGVGGLKKVGGETSGAFSSAGVGNGRRADEEPRPGFRDVLTARFFKLRPFLGGGCFWSSKNGLLSSAVRRRCMPTAKFGGDSGDDPGEGSVALESSTVEIVVVGEEVLEVVVDESLTE